MGSDMSSAATATKPPFMVKIHFRLDETESSGSGAGLESLWATDLGDGTVRVENSPWFAHGVAYRDVLRVSKDDDGALLAGEVVQRSGHCTIRLVVSKDEGTASALQEAADRFRHLGVTGEGFVQYRMIALDVPGSADLRRVRELLEDGQERGWWIWEEGFVTAAWEAVAAG